MLSILTFKDAEEQVEIVLDEQGIDELIHYLSELRKTKDHIHQTIGTELAPFPIGEKRKGKTVNSKHARIEFANREQWQ